MSVTKPAARLLAPTHPNAATRPDRGLLLDLDGTLVNSEHIHREAYRRWSLARGWEADEQFFALFTGRRALDVFRTEPGPWSGLDPQILVAEVLAQVPVDARPAEVPGARELIVEAHHSGWGVAVVTSAGPRWAHEVLDEILGVRALVTVLVTGDEVPHGKPDPTCFRLGAERLGVDVDVCLAVEDSLAGIRAAKAAGVPDVVGITTTNSADRLEAVGASLVVDDLTQLRLSGLT